MSFGPRSSGQMAAPVAPPPPPNPPQFASNTGSGNRQRKRAQQSTGFSSFMGGAQPQADTAQKTLLGA